MEQEKLAKYLRKVEDLVFDEEKIVTYKYLSRVLDVHVNVAKQLLYEFIMKQQKLNTCNISVTYLVAGSLKNGDNVVSIVNEDDINEACIEFDKITSKHVYSILKGKEADIKKIKDMLYIVDSQVEPLKRYPVYYDPVIEENTRDVKIAEPKANSESEQDIKQSSKTKKSIPKSGKETVLNFFNNSTQPKKAKKQVECERVQNGDAAGKIGEIELSQLKIDEEKKKKEKFSKKNGKKRKRIVSDSDSSESDEEKFDAMLCDENENSGDVHFRNNGENKEDEKNEKDEKDEKDEVGLSRTKKKRKKVVDKKITGEDGYIETVKEVMCETDSEGELEQKGNEAEVNKNPPSIPELNGVRGKNRKLENKAKGQPTLFSFFKKN